MSGPDGKPEPVPGDASPRFTLPSPVDLFARIGGFPGLGRWLRTATGSISAAVTLIAGILTVVFLLRPALRPSEGTSVFAATLSNPNLEQNVALGDYYNRRKLTPPTGTTPNQLQTIGNLVSFVVVIEGFEGKACRLLWSLLDANTKARVSNQDFVAQEGWPDGVFTPVGERDQASGEVWVPGFDHPGTYIVRLELFDPKGVRLTSLDSDAFTVVPKPKIAPQPGGLPTPSGPTSWSTTHGDVS